MSDSDRYKGLFTSSCNLSESDFFKVCFYRPQTKLREGHVFTGVCLSTGDGVGTHPWIHDTTGYDRQAGRTDPTGMLSCSFIVFTFL